MVARTTATILCIFSVRRHIILLLSAGGHNRMTWPSAYVPCIRRNHMDHGVQFPVCCSLISSLLSDASGRFSCTVLLVSCDGNGSRFPPWPVTIQCYCHSDNVQATDSLSPFSPCCVSPMTQWERYSYMRSVFFSSLYSESCSHRSGRTWLQTDEKRTSCDRRTVVYCVHSISPSLSLPDHVSPAVAKRSKTTIF